MYQLLLTVHIALGVTSIVVFIINFLAVAAGSTSVKHWLTLTNITAVSTLFSGIGLIFSGGSFFRVCLTMTVYLAAVILASSLIKKSATQKGLLAVL